MNYSEYYLENDWFYVLAMCLIFSVKKVIINNRYLITRNNCLFKNWSILIEVRLTKDWKKS